MISLAELDSSQWWENVACLDENLLQVACSAPLLVQGYKATGQQIISVETLFLFRLSVQSVSYFCFPGLFCKPETREIRTKLSRPNLSPWSLGAILFRNCGHRIFRFVSNFCENYETLDLMTSYLCLCRHIKLNLRSRSSPAFILSLLYFPSIITISSIIKASFIHIIAGALLLATTPYEDWEWGNF